MTWWQILLILIGAIAIGLAAGYLLHRLTVLASAAARRRRTARVEQVANKAVDVKPTVPDLYAEIEYNRRIANGEWNGQMQPFVTRAWDSRGDEVHALPVELRNELAEAYSDMALANSITWLATEMSRRSPGLDESYQKLRASVAARLNRVDLNQAPRVLTTKS